ncbi:MAG TPA: chorismate-binding protein [Myxococcota bacterium]|nr:chorismate-binding protein [Myxococcota bacterium]
MERRSARAFEAAVDPASDAGAISIAAQWCAGARALPGAPCVMTFGTRESALVLVGAERTLCLQRYAGEPLPAEVLWGRAEEFCSARAFVAGYIGFDAVWSDATRRPLNRGELAAPTLHLWEPSGVVRIEAAASRAARVSILQGREALRGLRPAPLGACEAVALRRFDSDAKRFRESVAQALAFIESGEGERVTLARRIELPDDLDLLASFAAPPEVGSSRVGRSFYLATPTLELAGHSPELLASGSREHFDCYKLSGTGPRHPDPAQDARLRAELLADAKVQEEHASSIAATRGALVALGAVTPAPLEVLDRPGLRHLMTPLRVTTAPGASWSRILRAVLPCGAQPRAAGLECLGALEPESRGAYYGVLGVRTPQGELEFSQVLRTLFRDPTGVHTLVGAAVTRGSTVDGETDETRIKLADIVAMRSQRSASMRSSTAGRSAMTFSS